MRHNDTHLYQFKNTETGDRGEVLGNSFWCVLKRLEKSPECGDGKYTIVNVDKGMLEYMK